MLEVVLEEFHWRVAAIVAKVSRYQWRIDRVRENRTFHKNFIKN